MILDLLVGVGQVGLDQRVFEEASKASEHEGKVLLAMDS